MIDPKKKSEKPTNINFEYSHSIMASSECARGYMALLDVRFNFSQFLFNGARHRQIVSMTPLITILLLYFVSSTLAGVVLDFSHSDCSFDPKIFNPASPPKPSLPALALVPSSGLCTTGLGGAVIATCSADQAWVNVTFFQDKTCQLPTDASSPNGASFLVPADGACFAANQPSSSPSSSSPPPTPPPSYNYRFVMFATCQDARAFPPILPSSGGLLLNPLDKVDDTCQDDFWLNHAGYFLPANTQPCPAQPTTSEEININSASAQIDASSGAFTLTSCNPQDQQKPVIYPYQPSCFVFVNQPSGRKMAIRSIYNFTSSPSSGGVTGQQSIKTYVIVLIGVGGAAVMAVLLWYAPLMM